MHIIRVVLTLIISTNIVLAKNDTVNQNDIDLLSNQTLFQWILDLNALGVSSDAGFRQAGTKADRLASEYLVNKISGFGIKNIRTEPVGILLSAPQMTSLILRNKKNQSQYHQVIWLTQHKQTHQGLTVSCSM